MEKEREIAEHIFQLFRNTKCKTNQGFLYRALDVQILQKLDPKEQEIFEIVYCGLQALEYIFVDKDGNFIRLSQKGYDYIYDIELVHKMNSIPWIVPQYNKTNWILAWNKLWNVIDTQEKSFYLSGPQFLALFCKIEESAETNYRRYIEERTNKGLSTSRKDYFRDLIDSLPEKKRYEFYVKIQMSFEDTVLLTTSFHNENNASKADIDINEFNDESISKECHPKVFISYSHDSEEHINWVLNFATKLRENGIDVILDQWEVISKGGSLLPSFMENSVVESERVLCILTPNYKKKTCKMEGGVGAEYSILSAELCGNITSSKFIPILCHDNAEESTPTFLKGRVRYELFNEEKLKNQFEDLLRDIYGEPKLKKPALGNKPKFD